MGGGSRCKWTMTKASKTWYANTRPTNLSVNLEINKKKKKVASMKKKNHSKKDKRALPGSLSVKAYFQKQYFI